MKRRYYVLIAVIGYLFFALASTPAAKVISLAKNNLTLPAHFYGVEGSVWNGSANSVLIDTHRIEQLHWSINPVALLLARVSADIKAQIQNQNVTGRVSINLMGDIHGEDIQAQLTAEDVQQLLALPFGELAGEFLLHIESVNWSDTGIPETVGSLQWLNAKLTLVDAVNLGQVMIEVKPDKEAGLIAVISNKDGMLSIDGDISITSQKNYIAQIDFKAASNANSNITQSLAMFAKKQSNGSYRFKQNGNLSQLGL